MNKTTHEIGDLFAQVGITVNGQEPWDIRIHNPKTYERLLTQPSLGFGEAYIEGWWDCDRLDELFFRILAAKLDEKVMQHYQLMWSAIVAKLKCLKYFLLNDQSKTKSLEVGKRHYDIGNDLYQCMLDPRMNYTCGYWANSNNLNDAQLAKMDLVCRKLGLKPGMRVLDIGCGFGSFAQYAAECYGVTVVGITISKEQQALAQKRCAGLPIDIRFQDYRDVDEKFDRICSLGMFEHVGYKNYRQYMKIAHRCLVDDGLFLLHTVGSNVSTVRGDEWINRYIFPHGMLPSVAQIGDAINGLFILEDWHNFGADYDKTLLAWHANFNQHWETLKPRYGEKFYRMWNYYLLSFAGSFRARAVQLWQIVLAKEGVRGGYQAVR